MEVFEQKSKFIALKFALKGLGKKLILKAAISFLQMKKTLGWHRTGDNDKKC